MWLIIFTVCDFFYVVGFILLKYFQEFWCIFRVILFFYFSLQTLHKIKEGREKITPLIYTACHGSVMYLPGDCWKRTRLCGRIGSCFEPDPLFPMKKIIIQYGRNHLLFIIIIIIINIIWNVSMWTLIVFLILSNLNHDHSIMYYR